MCLLVSKLHKLESQFLLGMLGAITVFDSEDLKLEAHLGEGITLK